MISRQAFLRVVLIISGTLCACGERGSPTAPETIVPRVPALELNNNGVWILYTIQGSQPEVIFGPFETLATCVHDMIVNLDDMQYPTNVHYNLYSPRNDVFTALGPVLDQRYGLSQTLGGWTFMIPSSPTTIEIRQVTYKYEDILNARTVVQTADGGWTDTDPPFLGLFRVWHETRAWDFKLETCHDQGVGG